eukprot:scaffold30436_cov160-Skeletonema_menzelii.AAC.1
MTLILDVFARSAMSLCMEMGRMIAIVDTTKIARSIPTSPLWGLNSVSVHLEQRHDTTKIF